jgi:hypothetical protein
MPKIFFEILIKEAGFGDNTINLQEKAALIWVNAIVVGNQIRES